MKYLRIYKQDDTRAYVTPSAVVFGNKSFVIGKNVVDSFISEETPNGNIIPSYINMKITCSEATTLSIWATKEDFDAQTVTTTLSLNEGENEVKIGSGIYRLGIITYNPSTGSRTGGNGKLLGLVQMVF